MNRYTYNGVTFQATAPRASTRDDKKYMRTVRYNGDERVVHWGSPDMDMQRDNDERRANFNARHNCEGKRDPFSPGFHACWHWNEGKAAMMTEQLIYYGGAVKALGDGRVGGYLVRFGDANTTDLEGEYFSVKTDFGRASTSDVYYQHGLDAKLGQRVLGDGTLKADDVGVWIEAQLELRDEYEKAIYELVERGKMGWSSGTAPNLVSREPDGKAAHITRWPLGLDASITPTPAEPRNAALPLKSFIISMTDSAPQEPEAAPEVRTDGDGGDVDAPPDDAVIPIQSQVEVVMTDNENTNTEQDAPPAPALDSGQQQLAALSAQVKALTEYMENHPRISRSGGFTVDGGTADRNIKTLGDFFVAVMRGDQKRLREVYGATKAQTEGSGAAGGFLIPEEFRPLLQNALNLNTGIPSLVQTIPVQAPSGRVPALDYTIVPTAGSGESAEAAGVGTNIRAEGGAYQEESANFEMIQFTVSDAVSGYVRVSRELSEDYAAIEAILTQRIAIAIGAKMERNILRGSGVGEPLGILNWGGLVTVDEATDNTFVVGDADNMLARFKGVMGQPVWVIHPSIITSIAAFERGTGGAVFQTNISGALSQSLHGYPIIMSQHLPQVGTDGYAILADFSSYGLFARGGIYVDYSEHADFMNGNNTWRFGQRVDGKPLMTGNITLAGPGNAYTVSPFVAIGNRT